MASRFVEADEEFIEETQNIKNTKQRTDYWTKIFPRMGKDERKK